MTKRRVIMESPYKGDIDRNVTYARRCVRDCVERGEAPIASHLLFTQPGILLDDVAEERATGVACGLAWLSVADAMVVYVDLGVSDGMREAIKAAHAARIEIEIRKLLPDVT